MRKVRARAVATPGTVSLALLLGYVSGLRGESLFKSDYTKMLDCSFERTIELAGTPRAGLDLAQARRAGGRSAFPESDHCTGNGVVT